jgi:hypothetical protein
VALATVLSRLSRRGEAQTAAQRALGLAHEDWEIRNAQSMIDYLQSAPAAANRPAASADLAARVNACSSGDKTMCAGVANDLEAVCKGGESTACGALAWMYETGAGVALDAARAAALHAQACEGGQKASCVRAAFLRATAKGAPGEQGRDVAALDRMCAEGTLDACTALGLVHARKGNLARARELLKKACDGGQADACRMVQSLPK